MKKIVFIIYALVIALSFTSCEDPYANQLVAAPGSYDQETLQDTSGFVVALKSGINPLVIKQNQLASPISLITASSVLTLADTSATIQYKFEFADNADFDMPKSIANTYSGVAAEDVSVGCSEFNDSIKVYNNDAVQRPVYIRLLAFIVKDGLKSVYKSNTLILNVTPYNYPPVAINDIVSLPMNGFVAIDVTENDTDLELDSLVLLSVTAPGNGTAVITADNKVLYTPTNGYSGADNFSYTISDGNGNTSTANVDITVMAIMPYTATTPRPYYIIGMANGAWGNSVDGLGVSIYPLSVIEGNKYNVAGDGEFTFTGYFWASRGFKLIRDLGNWDEQWGIKAGVFVHNDGGSSDIKVAADGYYTITLNSITNTMTMVPATVTPKSFTSMGMIGEMNGWSGDIAMTGSEATNNHIWYTTHTFESDFTPPVGSGGMKFRADGGWTDNWGAGTFPVGLGTNGGTNIPHKAGTYTVIFNDIDGNFYFIKK